MRQLQNGSSQGVITGGVLLAKGNVIAGIVLAIEHLVKAVAYEQSIYITFFLFIFGVFGEIMKVFGGIKGFTELTSKYVKTEKGELGAVWLVTPVTFIDCCFNDIAAGMVGKSLIDKVKGIISSLIIVLAPVFLLYTTT